MRTREILGRHLPTRRPWSRTWAASFLQDQKDHWHNPMRRECILQAVRWMDSDPSMLGVTGNLLAIAYRLRQGAGMALHLDRNA